MKVLYISYWPTSEPLTDSIIVPRLKFLSEMGEMERVFFISIEQDASPGKFSMANISHTPFTGNRYASVIVRKAINFIGLLRLSLGLIHGQRIDFVICNSPLAGIVGYLASFVARFKLIVECFEPHADYMLESGVWSRYGARYLLLKFFENRLARGSYKLLPVTKNYTDLLVRNGIPSSRIQTVPNGIDQEVFKFNSVSRLEIREQLKILPTDIVGIYVGKFGDIYYSDEAFDLFQKAFEYFGDKFYLIILSGQCIDEINNQVARVGIAIDRFFISKVSNTEVPRYLSASDFAFATIKPAPVRKYCCPVKVGEYWANGLLVLLEPGIGDDSEIIKSEGGGVLLNMNNPEEAFSLLHKKLSQGRTPLVSEITKVARKYRDFENVKKAYIRILK